MNTFLKYVIAVQLRKKYSINKVSMKKKIYKTVYKRL